MPARSRRWLFALGAIIALSVLIALTLRHRAAGAADAVVSEYVIVTGYDEFGEPVHSRVRMTEAEHRAHLEQLAERARREVAEYERLQRESAVDPQRVDLRTVGPDDWPQFRGPNRDGVVPPGPRPDPSRAASRPVNPADSPHPPSAGTRAPARRFGVDWKTRPPNELWRRRIGKGWSSFAIIGDFAITHEQLGKEEAVTCRRVSTGNPVWKTTYPAWFDEYWTEEGPRATPTISGGRIFALGGAGDLLCLEGADGGIVWRRNILEDTGAEPPLFGVTGSPLVTEGMVIVNPGGPRGSVAAYSATTGAPIWKAGTARAAYASPTQVRLAGIDQVLDFNAEGLASYELRTGQPLWRHPWITNPPEMNNVCQPIAPPDLQAPDVGVVFLASGYDVGCALLEVRPPGPSPATSPAPPWAWSVRERWKTRSLKAKFAPAMLRGGFLFGIDDGIFACVDLRDGRRVWKQGRFGHGQAILVDDLLLILAENGDLGIMTADVREPRTLGRIPALKARSWSFPALAGRTVLVRNNREAIAFELPAP